MRCVLSKLRPEKAGGGGRWGARVLHAQMLPASGWDMTLHNPEAVR